LIVLLPHVSPSVAIRIAERIRRRVTKETNPSVSISIGISWLTSAESSIDELVEQADQALYYSKANGRNKVTVYEQLNQNPS
jgi:diguanylate cyclase (GGDEF)-like protein